MTGIDKAHILPIGHLIANRYKVEQWWQGGMAAVYQVRDTKDGTGKIYAIKMPFVTGRPWDQFSIRRQFQKEISIWADLPSDQHIVQLYVADVYDARPYLIMEYVPGGTLATRLKYGQQLTFEQAMDFAVQICTGMSRASSQAAVVHLDLKPSNLLITPDGLLKISDFGIAQRTWEFVGNPLRTRAGTVVYMSPEQLLGDPVDVRSDLFSFGAILYEMLAGNLPYPIDLTDDSAENVRRPALLHRVLRKSIPLTRQLAIDNDIDYPLVSWALGKVDGHRYSLSYCAEEQLDRRVRPIVTKCLSNFAQDRFSDFGFLRNRLLATLPQFVDQSTINQERLSTAVEWYNRGLSHEIAGEYAHALQCINKALASGLTRIRTDLAANAYLSAARCYMRLGDSTTAVAMVKEARALQPSHPAIPQVLQEVHDTHGTSEQ